jgi:hypothetical protein
MGHLPFLRDELPRIVASIAKLPKAKAALRVRLRQYSCYADSDLI